MHGVGLVCIGHVVSPGRHCKGQQWCSSYQIGGFGVGGGHGDGAIGGGADAAEGDSWGNLQTCCHECLKVQAFGCCAAGRIKGEGDAAAGAESDAIKGHRIVGGTSFCHGVGTG